MPPWTPPCPLDLFSCCIYNTNTINQQSQNSTKPSDSVTELNFFVLDPVKSFRVGGHSNNTALCFVVYGKVGI